MGNSVNAPPKDIELPKGEIEVLGHSCKLDLGKVTNYPVHSRPCSSCGNLIVLISESQPDYKFNCTECAEYIRKGDLRYEDCYERSPPEPVTFTENKRTNPQQTEMMIWRNAGRFQLIDKKITRDLLNDESSFLLGEIASLCQNKRSCLVQVENQTSYIISCFGKAILGMQEHTHDNEIQPKHQKSYFFKKSNFSLKGCAGILTFTVKGSTLCFLVAFRNYTVQMREQSYNKVAILRINDSEIEPDMDFFSKLMKNKESCPSFDDCCYVSSACTFKATIASKQPNIEIQYDNIEIKVSMTCYHQSQVFVTVSSKKSKEITGSREH